MDSGPLGLPGRSRIQRVQNPWILDRPEEPKTMFLYFYLMFLYFFGKVLYFYLMFLYFFATFHEKVLKTLSKSMFLGADV